MNFMFTLQFVPEMEAQLEFQWFTKDILNIMSKQCYIN